MLKYYITPIYYLFRYNIFNETRSIYFRYHVPRSWLHPSGNLLVVFEEWGGNPYGISLVKREVSSVCADIHEWQPTLVNWQMETSGKVNKPLRPKAHLSCASGQKISSIKFASFGTPEGACGNYRQGSCHAFHSYDVFERVCTYLIHLYSLHLKINVVLASFMHIKKCHKMTNLRLFKLNH